MLPLLRAPTLKAKPISVVRNLENSRSRPFWTLSSIQKRGLAGPPGLARPPSVKATFGLSQISVAAVHRRAVRRRLSHELTSNTRDLTEIRTSTRLFFKDQ